MIPVRLTSEPDGRVCVESPYHAAFVEGLKQAIEYSGREWRPDRKRWLVSVLYADALLGYLRSIGAQVRDDRVPDLPGPGTGEILHVPPMPPELRASFETLHCAYTAPLAVCEAAFKALALLYHPDRGGDPDIFKALVKAIETIRRHLQPPPSEAGGDVPVPKGPPW